MPAQKFVAGDRDHEPARNKGAALPVRRVLVLLSLPVCVLFALVFGEEEAHACKCAPSTLEERLQKSSAVFSGVAAEVEEDSSSDARPQHTTFEVEQSRKSVSEEQVVVQGDGSSCDFRFQEGERYLVYATGGGGQGGKTTPFQTSVCQGTRLLEESLAADDLRVLGSPQWTSETNTTEKAAEEGSGGGKKLPSSGGDGIALLALGGGALIVGCGLLIRKSTKLY